MKVWRNEHLLGAEALEVEEGEVVTGVVCDEATAEDEEGDE
jgi:hypothetical protein